MTYIGIDPGAKGGIAAIINDEVYKCAPYSDTELLNLCKKLSEAGECKCCLEQVGAMPGQGVTSMFSFGKNFGYIKGVLEANGISYQEIRPQRWKKEFGLNTDKKKSIDVCRHLFPTVSLRRTEKCHTDHDGMAEALLMAEYAKRKFSEAV